MKNDNKHSISAKKKHITQNKKKQQQDIGTSLWVRNFVAISNCFPNLAKGMCWFFGSLILLAVVIFIMIGNIGSGDLMAVAQMYFSKK